MNDTAIQKAQAKIDRCWHLLLLFALSVSATALPDMAFASNNAIEEVFCNLVNVLTGPTGKAIATVAIIAVGIGALLGKISWGMALIVAVGVALVFGAATIVDSLNGGSVTTCVAGNIANSDNDTNTTGPTR